MGKRIGLALLVIGGIVLLVLGLPVTFFILFDSSPQYPTSSVAGATLISVLFFVLPPAWVMKKGWAKYKYAPRMEKRGYSSQPEKTQMATEPERIERGRREMEEAGPRIPLVIREREIIKEIIKIKCHYCGKVHEERLDRCPHCGA